MPLLSFQDCLNQLEENTTPSILLANGFSQAWNRDIFNYQNLLEKSNFGERDEKIKEIFEKLETYDFEKVMRALQTGEIIGEAYSLSQVNIEEIRSDKEHLKNTLIDVIANTHPARSSHITREQYHSAKIFISQFDSIFTLNYDLLLYWIANKYDIEPRGYLTDDGFRGNEWENHEDQKLFFLHGGLHIYDSGTAIKKITFRAANDRSIVDQVRENLNVNKFPLFVSEPTYDKKLRRIEHNPYLNTCYKMLKTLKGVLFIHGHSFDENDKHIFDQIKNSHINKVFVSVFGDENSDQNTRTKANARAYLERFGLVVYFYDAATVNIWN